VIANQTVLVLGAGASAPFGFPTGRSLLLRIGEGLRQPTSALRVNLEPLGYAEQDLEALGRDLALSMQPSVDAFLENRTKFVDMGKAAMSAALIPYERPEALERPGDSPSWYEYLFAQLAPTLDDFARGMLSIITFNYDRSLEFFLLTALVHSFGLPKSTANDLLSGIRVIHVYGQLGSLSFSSPRGRAYSPEVTADAIRQSVASIKILPEKREEDDTFLEARGLIACAKVLCFLGFGYHPTNMRRLDVNGCFRGERLLGSAFALGADERRRAQALLTSEITLGTRKDDILYFIREYPVFG